MKTFKIAFFALLFMMTGVVSAAPLTVTDTSTFITDGGNFSGDLTGSYTAESVHINSGSLTSTDTDLLGNVLNTTHTFDIANSGIAGVDSTFRLWIKGGSSSLASSISNFSVTLGGIAVAIVDNRLAPTPFDSDSLGIKLSSLLLAAGDSTELVVSGIFTNASYELTLATPIPAAVWLFGSALMGLVGVSRRKSTAVAA